MLRRPTMTLETSVGRPTAHGPDGDRGVSRAERSARTAELLDRAGQCTDEAERDDILNEVIVLNRGVAEAVASRYQGRGVARDDLRQVAYEGLVKAVRRFDPATRNDLLTYAVPTIRGELLRHFRDHGWSVRPPRRVQELQWRVNKKIEELEQELGHAPTDAEIKAALEISDDDYREAIEAFGCFQPTSLEQPATADSTATLGDFIPEEDSDTAGQRGPGHPVSRRPTAFRARPAYPAAALLRRPDPGRDRRGPRGHPDAGLPVAEPDPR